jgi:hypothetical protein
MKAIDLAVVKALVNQAIAKLSKVKPPEVDYELVKSFIPPARDALPAKEVDYDLIKTFIPPALPALPATKVDYDLVKSFIPPALPANEVDYELVKSFIPPALPAKEVDYDLIRSFIPPALKPKEVDYELVKSFIPVAKVGQAGRGIASIKVNSENMLVVTYDDGDLDIAGKVSFTKETSGGEGFYSGAPLGSFGITGTKVNDSGELVILGPWGKQFNTGFVSSSTSSTSGSAVLDFGSSSRSTDTVVTGVPSVRANSIIVLQVKFEATEDHSVDEIIVDPIRVVAFEINVGVGFTIRGTMDNSFTNGKYNVSFALL